MDSPEHTKQRLLEAAGRIFADKGFRSATVQEICKQAEANIAAVNYHFGAKERLYIETVRHAGHFCTSEVPLPQWEPGTPATMKLRDFIRTMLNRVAVDRTPEWPGKLIMRELAQPTDACAEFVREFARPNFEMLLGILQDLLPTEVSPAKRQLIVFSIMGQILHYRFARPIITLLVGEEQFRALDAERLTEHITGFTLAALSGFGVQGSGFGVQESRGQELMQAPVRK